MDEEMIKVSISGRLYDVPKRLLEKPLKQQAKTHLKRNSSSKESLHHFPRHVGCFEAALDYLNQGELHMPQDVCPSVFIREMEFWGVDVNEMKNCCKIKLDVFLEELKALDTINKKGTPEAVNIGSWKGFFHESLEEPQYSLFGQVYFWIAMTFVLLSIFVMCAETMPEFRHKLSRKEWAYKLGIEFFDDEFDYFLEHSEENQEKNYSTPQHVEQFRHQRGAVNHVINALSIACGVFFITDILFRFTVHVKKKRFFCSFLNMVDIIAVLAFISKVGVVMIFPELNYIDSYLDITQILSAIRVFRIFRLTSHSSGLRVFVFSLRAGIREIWLLFLFLAIGTLVFASIFHFCERSQSYSTIPGAFWWALITMTTVGYGDTVPKTVAGKIFGSLCAISGVLVMAVTVPIFASKFAIYYQRVGRSRCVIGSKYRPFRRYSSFVKPMPENGNQKM